MSPIKAKDWKCCYDKQGLHYDHSTVSNFNVLQGLIRTRDHTAMQSSVLRIALKNWLTGNTRQTNQIVRRWIPVAKVCFIRVKQFVLM